MSMDEELYRIEAHINRHNHAVCILYPDRVVLQNRCDGGLMPVFDNRERSIPLQEITGVVVSKGGVRLIVHHPNCIQFRTVQNKRTVDDLFRDRSFHSSEYIDEGVCQLAPKTEAELDEKLETARRIKAYIETWQKEHASLPSREENP